ncbi:MAG: hypothetical protein HYU63_00165 [Armatimonadetes bacterium]|nr:hypothetical protein [Armatimonadota bacterium]
MQKRRSSIAVIIDEFGQTSGLITIERLLEEIVGEIKDEYDQEDLYYSQIKEGIAILDAKTNLEEVNQRLNLELPPGDYQSLGGFLINLLGRIPVKGERIEFKDIEFYIEEMEGYKLNKIMIINKSLQKIRKEKENKEKKI